MKRCFIFLMAVVLSLSCNPDDPSHIKNDTNELIVTAEVSEIKETTAVLFGFANLPDGMTGVSFGIICSTDANPTMENGIVSKSKELNNDHKFSCEFDELFIGTKYYYKAFLDENGFIRTGKILSFTTKDIKWNTNEAVDLGLSVKWSSSNIGASSPFECGNYYAWGETEAKDTYTEENYKWYKKINGSWGFFYDGGEKLKLSDDAAHVKLGGNWRMPTKTECSELVKNCKWKKTGRNGLTGYLVTGPSGSSIYLPSAGSMVGDYNLDGGEWGKYWSSSPRESNGSYAWSLFWDYGTVLVFNLNRYCGQPIRPVCE